MKKMTTEPTATPPAVTEAPAAAPAETPAPAAEAPAPAAETPAPALVAEVEFTPYEIAAPEGLPIDKDQLKQFTDFANELKIPKDKAEAFSQNFAKIQFDAVQKQMATWRTESEADTEIGGPKYAENVGVAKKALQKFGGDEVLEVLDKTGLGNHKAIIRTFLKVGKAMSDDVVATQGSAAPKAEPTFASALMSVANSNK